MDISVPKEDTPGALMTRTVGMSIEDIKEAAKLVLEGRLIVYPTDTVYGLGCNPFDADAVDRLVKAKERVKGSLPILVSSLKDAERLGEISGLAATLANRFWPGPLTLVVPLRTNFPAMVTGDTTLVGLRIPNHETAMRLIKECGGALIGTSANISGRPSLKTAKEVLRELEGRVDLVVDGGPASLGRESTVVKVLGDESTVLRDGALSRDDILKALSRDGGLLGSRD
ncbi:MAG TPA: L-threonylcarbamoyladenylate synthase [Candidatus Bathyarchaeia archaeon]